VRGDLGSFLAEGGAIVGGGAAMGATIGFVVRSVVHDFHPDVDPEGVARGCGLLGGAAGLAVLILRL